MQPNLCRRLFLVINSLKSLFEHLSIMTVFSTAYVLLLESFLEITYDIGIFIDEILYEFVNHSNGLEQDLKSLLHPSSYIRKIEKDFRTIVFQ